MTDPLFQVELPLREEWDSVEMLRAAAVGCLTAVLRNPEYCEVLGMVASELVENAVKYGAWTGEVRTGNVSRLRIEGTVERIEILVCNPVHPSDPGLSRLLALLQKIESAASPEEAYVEMMREAAVRTEGSGGLGLARIACEADCRLSAHVDPSGYLEVRAVASPREWHDLPILRGAATSA